MRSKDISKVIDRFIVEDRMHAILIDGPWGSGKTYQIKNFLNTKHKDEKVYYVSLFGCESVDEIHTMLYNLVHPNKVRNNRIAQTISKSIKVIPYVGGIGEALEYQLSSNPKQLKSKAVVIFDDLERVGDKVDFNSLLGYFNQLTLQKIKIVCLCSSNGIRSDMASEFIKFKEKVFDRVFEINENQEEVIYDIFKKYSINNIDNLIVKFNKNIRRAQKTYVLFDELMTYLKEHNYNFDRDINELELLGCCADVINIAFRDNVTKYKDEKSNNSYKYYEEVFGVNIARGVQHLFEKKDSFNIVSENKQKFYYAILRYFIFNDTVSLDKTFRLKEENNDDILDCSFYYLSDENKKIYIEEFINKSINDEIKLDEYYMNMLFDILKYSDYVFDEEVRDTIIIKMIKGMEKHKDRKLYLDYIFGQLLVRVYDKNRINNVKVWKNKLTELYAYNKELNIMTQLEEYEEDYSELYYVIEDIIRDEDLLKSEKIKSYVQSKNYYIPDLSLDATQQLWSFAHVMANYAYSVNESEDFVNRILQIANDNKNNVSLIDRLDAIVRHKIDPKIRIKNMVK